MKVSFIAITIAFVISFATTTAFGQVSMPDTVASSEMYYISAVVPTHIAEQPRLRVVEVVQHTPQISLEEVRATYAASKPEYLVEVYRDFSRGRDVRIYYIAEYRIVDGITETTTKTTYEISQRIAENLFR